MRRSGHVIAAIAATAVCWFAASTSAAQAAPTLALEPSCAKDASGETIYAVNISLTGLAPNGEFSGKLEWTYIDPPPGQVGGGVGPVTFNADSNGSFAFGPIGVVGVKAIFTATVIYQGQTLTQTLRVTCEPTTKDDCKNGAWRNFPGFRSQGDCVSFVATRGKNLPANQPG